MRSQFLIFLFTILLIFGFCLKTQSNAKEKALLLNQDKVIAKKLVNLSKKLHWKKYSKLWKRIKNPVLKKALLWYQLKSPNSGAKFEQISDFIVNNPDWPQKKLLQMRAEQLLLPTAQDMDVFHWFKERMPQTPNGTTRLASSYLRSGNQLYATKLIQRIWINGNFGTKQETQFYRQFRRYMTIEDHINRLDRLLWDGKYYPVRRMYRRINVQYRALAEARTSLRRMRGGVDKAIKRVPRKLKQHPGLVYERLRWRRKKDKNSRARELLKSPPKDLGRPLRWWHEREILARRALDDGEISEAYLIIRDHGLKKVYPSGYVAAEWFAGWIALRFLEDKAIAFQHFKDAFSVSKFPISKARCAYWLGRAAESQKKAGLAQFWYEAAFKYNLTFYGQLAANRLKSNKTFEIYETQLIDSPQITSFKNNELVTVVSVLGKAGLSEILGPFIRQLNTLNVSESWRVMVGKLANDFDRPDLAIMTAKYSIKEGLNLTKLGFPLLKLKLKTNLEGPFIHAIIRQESAFNRKAVSSAGARGLMQLLPSTASRVAKKSSLPYSRKKLTTDIRYNLKLGQAYLKELLDAFNKSYILTLAAYNAGPNRVKKWIKNYGDPRHMEVDPIDWIEKIPFGETRNYVQRVMENLHVYRRLMRGDGNPFNPEQDLQR